MSSLEILFRWHYGVLGGFSLFFEYLQGFISKVSFSTLYLKSLVHVSKEHKIDLCERIVSPNRIHHFQKILWKDDFFEIALTMFSGAPEIVRSRTKLEAPGVFTLILLFFVWEQVNNCTANRWLKASHHLAHPHLGQFSPSRQPPLRRTYLPHRVLSEGSAYQS